MASSSSLHRSYDNISWIVKIVLQLFFGAFISPAYRIIKGLEKQSGILIIFGIIALIPIFWFIDLVSIILTNRFVILAD